VEEYNLETLSKDEDTAFLILIKTFPIEKANSCNNIKEKD
jgi:hypothetical protein